MCHLQVNDEIPQRDFHMAEVVIGKKTWDHFDYDITLWSDRGKGERKSYGIEEEPRQKIPGPTILYISQGL